MKCRGWWCATVAVAAVWSVFAAPSVAEAQRIANVVETGGDNTGASITAQWTGQTFTVVSDNVPANGLVAGDQYTVGAFGHLAPTFVDRNHSYVDDNQFFMKPVPSYLVGGEYIMIANNNRDNADFKLEVTLSVASNVYLLIDNRLGDGGGGFLDPPTFGPTAMQWVLDQGWLPTANGLNHGADPSVPDEVTIDLNTNGTIENWSSVYYKQFPAGTFSLFQADNAGQNMYGVVVGAVPEPSAALLLSTAAAASLCKRRRQVG